MVGGWDGDLILAILFVSFSSWVFRELLKMRLFRHEEQACQLQLKEHGTKGMRIRSDSTRKTSALRCQCARNEVSDQCTQLADSIFLSFSLLSVSKHLALKFCYHGTSTSIQALSHGPALHTFDSVHSSPFLTSDNYNTLVDSQVLGLRDSITRFEHVHKVPRNALTLSKPVLQTDTTLAS